MRLVNSFFVHCFSSVIIISRLFGRLVRLPLPLPVPRMLRRQKVPELRQGPVAVRDGVLDNLVHLGIGLLEAVRLRRMRVCAM